MTQLFFAHNPIRRGNSPTLLGQVQIHKSLFLKTALDENSPI